jgi:phasin
MTVMTETTKGTKSAASPFDVARLNLPNLAMPEAFREIAEKSAAQTKDTYEKMKAAAEEATDLLEHVFTTAAAGATAYNRKVIESARSNANAAFDHALALVGTKSLSEVIEVSSTHTRKHFEALTEQTKALAALAHKVTTETAEPVKAGITKAFKKVA